MSGRPLRCYIAGVQHECSSFSPILTSLRDFDTVRWGVEYTWARRHDSTGQIVFPESQTIYIETTISDNKQYTHMVNESADGAGIAGSTMEVDAIIMCRFFRDATHANDTFPDAVFLLSVDIHYQSLVKTTPLRVPPFV